MWDKDDDIKATYSPVPDQWIPHSHSDSLKANIDRLM